ncbi:MAG: element excision factor XisI family protein [Bacteroidota bacterium]
MRYKAICTKGDISEKNFVVLFLKHGYTTMDQVSKFRALTRQAMSDLISNYYLNTHPIEANFVEDNENGHYLIFLQGWRGMKHIYGISIHVEVKQNGKVWIHRDSSSVTIIDHLEKAGIPTSQMVVSWHPPVARKHTEFAVG